jgi:hypothetical protein
MPRALPLLALLALACGCAREPSAVELPVSEHRDRAAEFSGFEILAAKFLQADESWERAQWVEGGPELREEMDAYFAGRPKATSVRVEAVNPRRLSDTAVVVASVTAGGERRRLTLCAKKGAAGWVIDWRATRELWE